MDMDAPSLLSTWLDRFRTWWKRIFFWQNAPVQSIESAPEPQHDQALVAHITAPAPLPRWQQFRYLSHIFPKKERSQFWSSLGIGFCFLIIAIGFFIQPHLLLQPTSGGTLTEGVVGTPKWVNPVLAPLSDVDSDLSKLLYSGLFRYDHLTLTSDLAISTQVLNNGHTLEVALRQDARFHDGQILTADDVVFTINDALKNPVWHSPLAKAFKNITAIRIDNNTVQFKMDDPAMSISELKELLTIGILPAHVWQDANDGSPQLAEGNLKPIGSGPYQFKSFTRDAHGTILTFTLKRFEGYYGNTPYLDQRDFRFYPDRKSAELALQSNQIDALAFVPWSEVSSLLVADEKTLSLELPQVTTVFYNTQDATLKDDAVRSALSLTIDRGELATRVAHATPIQTPFPFFEGYASSSQLTNIDQARQLLDARGWKLDEVTGQRFLQPVAVRTTVRTRRGVAVTAPLPTFSTSTPLTISILVPSQGDVSLVAEYLKQRWSLLGAVVTIEPSDRSEIIHRSFTDHSQQVVIFNVPAANDADLIPFWSNGDNNLNFSQWTSTALTNNFQLLAAANSPTDVTAARTKITDAILAAHAASFVLRPAYAYFVPSSLLGTQDLQIHSLSDRLSEMENWYLQTQYRWKSAP